METDKQGTIRCVYCEEVLALAPVIESWVDAEGREHCPDGGWHKPDGGGVGVSGTPRRADPIRNDGYGWCYRCGESGKRSDSHSTYYTDSSGCFPLCEPCWSALTPETRLPYYRMLWHTWASYGEDHNGEHVDTIWKQMEAAVMEGR